MYDKIISGLLVFVLGGTFTTNYRVGEQSELTKSLSSAMGKFEQSMIKVADAVGQNKNEIIAIKAQNNFLINEQSEIRPIVFETRAEQIERKDEIDCINQIREVLGCKVPWEHP